MVITRIMPLRQQKLCIGGPAVTRIAGNEPAVICFLWVGHIVDDVTDRPTFCAALADMKRHDSRGCHRSDLLPEKKTACHSRPLSLFYKTFFIEKIELIIF